MRIPPLPIYQPPPVREDLAETDSVSAVGRVKESASARLYRPVTAVGEREAGSERRHVPDRRKVCLLRKPLPWLFEFRQAGDRRRHNRRHDDNAEHVDDWG